MIPQTPAATQIHISADPQTSESLCTYRSNKPNKARIDMLAIAFHVSHFRVYIHMHTHAHSDLGDKSTKKKTDVQINMNNYAKFIVFFA